MSSNATRIERTIDDAKRDEQAATLRSRGYTYSQIAEAMGYADGSGAHKAVKRALLTIPREAAIELVQIESARLDMLAREALAVLARRHVTVSHGRVIKDEAGEPLLDDGPKLQAVEALRRISESYRKLHGLDAPARHVVETITSDATEAAIALLEAQLAVNDSPSVSAGG